MSKHTVATEPKKYQFDNDPLLHQELSEQDDEMQKHDKKIDMLTHGVVGLKKIAVTIGDTIDSHNIMLDGVNDDVDGATHRLRVTTNRVQKLSDKTNSKCCCLILFLILIIILLIIVYFM